MASILSMPRAQSLFTSEPLVTSEGFGWAQLGPRKSLDHNPMRAIGVAIAYEPRVASRVVVKER